MRRSLADSLQYVHSVAGRSLDIAQDRLDRTKADIIAHRLRPGVFGRYYQLVIAIEQDERERARNAFDQLASLASRPADLSINPFTKDGLGDDFALYDELIDQSKNAVPWVVPLQAGHGANISANVREALDIIESIDPNLAEEIRGLVVEIVGASAYQGPGARLAGSGSSMMLWGLVVFNADRYATVDQVVDVLVHEAAHLLLFAHTVDGPLVKNPADKLYPSPLRLDERPMDGVLHATFVTARRYYFNRLMQNASEAWAPGSAALAERRAKLKQLYDDGIGVIREHGELTPMGRSVVDEMCDYMNAAR